MQEYLNAFFRRGRRLLNNNVHPNAEPELIFAGLGFAVGRDQHLAVLTALATMLLLSQGHYILPQYLLIEPD